MRVWAIASCGGLLALSACSADQANGPTPTTTDPETEGTAEINERSRLALRPAANASPLAQPEIRPRQSLSTPTARSTPTAGATPELVGPETQQLRARIQRLRAQQQERSLPQAGAPLARTARATVQQVPTPAPPSPGGAATSAGVSLDLPELPASRPAPAAPGPSARPDPATSVAAADLQSVAAASLARNYPIAPLQHQGYSQRPRQQPLVVQAAPAATARLHSEPGGLALADSTRPAPGQTGDSPEATPDAADAIAANRAPDQIAPSPSRGSVSPLVSPVETHQGLSGAGDRPTFSPTTPRPLGNSPGGAQTAAPGTVSESLPLNDFQPSLPAASAPSPAMTEPSSNVARDISGLSATSDRPAAHLGQAIAADYSLSTASPGTACPDPLAHGSFAQPQVSPGDQRPAALPAKTIPEKSSLGLANCGGQTPEPTDTSASATEVRQSAVAAPDLAFPTAPVDNGPVDLSVGVD